MNAMLKHVLLQTKPNNRVTGALMILATSNVILVMTQMLCRTKLFHATVVTNGLVLTPTETIRMTIATPFTLVATMEVLAMFELFFLACWVTHSGGLNLSKAQRVLHLHRLFNCAWCD